MSDHSSLLANLQGQLDDALRPLVASAPATALLDFPSYANVGDSAIWLGELASLERLDAPAPQYTCDLLTYDRRTLAKRIGSGIILLSGGGNFGDLWPDHQLFRERVISDFPKNRIVQLPQSVHFQSAATLRRARGVFSKHSRLTLMLRDAESLAVATRELSARCVLAPDMAFGLDPLARIGDASHDIVWLKRSDREDSWAGDDGVLAQSRVQVDWVEEAPTPLLRVRDALSRAATTQPLLQPAARWLLTAAYPFVARARLDHGVRLLSSARVVVTDRLHGHILCMLLSIPHVVLDNSYGKLSRFISAWTGKSRLVRVALTPRLAARAAAELAADVASGNRGA